MSLKLVQYFKSKGCLGNTNGYNIPVADLKVMRLALQEDIDAFVVNGLISLSASLTSLNRDNYSWSFIQSYYSLFFFARAFNGINDYAVVYKDRTPYGIKIQLSESFKKLKGNSHDVVLEQFKLHFKSDILLVNKIEELCPVDWFNTSRNHINYALNPQTDPYPPINLFRYNNDLRKWIATYISDRVHIYTFDPCHCYLAYPLQLLLRIHQYYIENEITNKYLDRNKFDYFRKNLCDTKGPMNALIAKIQEISPSSED